MAPAGRNCNVSAAWAARHRVKTTAAIKNLAVVLAKFYCTSFSAGLGRLLVGDLSGFLSKAQRIEAVAQVDANGVAALDLAGGEQVRDRLYQEALDGAL